MFPFKVVERDGLPLIESMDKQAQPPPQPPSFRSQPALFSTQLSPMGRRPAACAGESGSGSALEVSTAGQVLWPYQVSAHVLRALKNDAERYLKRKVRPVPPGTLYRRLLVYVLRPMRL